MDTTLTEIDALLEAGDIKRAEAPIARLLRTLDPQLPERAPVLLRRARVRLLSERPDEALEDLDACCALQPALAHDAEVLELKGDAFFARFELAPVGFADRSDADQALSCYSQLVDSVPEQPNLGWILYQKGRILLSENRVHEAVTAFQEAYTKPSRVSSLTSLCYERLGFVELFENRNPSAALVCFSQAIKAYPAGESAGWLVHLHILRSRALREQRLYPEALSAARRAMFVIDPRATDYQRTLPEANLALGEALAHISGREEEAVDYLVQFLMLSKRPLGVDVTWSRVYETIGDLSFRLGRYEPAIDSYQGALAFNPYHPLDVTLRYQIARCYYRLQKYDAAASTIEQLQALATEEGEAVLDYRVFNVLGNAYFALKRYVPAAEAYRQALALAPSGTEQVEQIQTYLRFSEEVGG